MGTNIICKYRHPETELFNNLHKSSINDRTQGKIEMKQQIQNFRL